MRRAAVLCLILVVPLLACADGAQKGALISVSDYRVVGTPIETRVKDLRRIVTTVQKGDSPINRFVIERVLPADRNPRSLRPVILSPALGQNQQSYTLGFRPDGADFESSIAANLARGGSDVFLYSTRQALLAPHSCDPTPNLPNPCPEASGWGLQARLDDFAFIRGQIALEHGPIKPVVGGHSLGGGTGVAAVNQDPNAYAGLLIIEGLWALKNDEAHAAERAGYHDLCSVYRQQLVAGPYFDTSFVENGQALLYLSQMAPNDPSPLPGLPPDVRTNREAYLFFLRLPSAGPIGPMPSILATGLTLAATDGTGFLYASETLATSQIYAMNYYTPIADFADLACTLSGDDQTFTRNLGAFTGPVLVFQAENGVGTEMQAGLDLLGSRKIQVRFYKGFGHNDLIVHRDHATQLEQPILDWMDRVLDQ